MKAVKGSKKVQEWGVYSLLLAASTGLLWWQISPKTYWEFDSICKNYGYNDCMRWYWENLKFFQVATGVFAVCLAVSLVVWGYFGIKSLATKR